MQYGEVIINQNYSNKLLTKINEIFVLINTNNE